MNNNESKPPNPNRARDHLANERTYLAWIRTAIALIGFGVVIVRLRYLLPPQVHSTGQGWHLGLVFGAVGLLMVVFATTHYFHVLHAIESQSYEPEKRWIIICSGLILLIGAGVLYYLLSNAPVSVDVH
jgi:putative membrane protein